MVNVVVIVDHVSYPHHRTLDIQLSPNSHSRQPFFPHIHFFCHSQQPSLWPLLPHSSHGQLRHQASVSDMYEKLWNCRLQFLCHEAMKPCLTLFDSTNLCWHLYVSTHMRTHCSDPQQLTFCRYVFDGKPPALKSGEVRVEKGVFCEFSLYVRVSESQSLYSCSGVHVIV